MNRLNTKFHICIFWLFFLLCQCTIVPASDLTLEWDPSVSPNIAGYKVYVGNAPRTYGNPITIGNQTWYTLFGLIPGRYYFSVTAFNMDGVESDFSNEVFADISENGTVKLQLVLPRFYSGQIQADPDETLYTGMAIANMDSQPATLAFTAFDDSGNIIAGNDITNPRTLPRDLNPGEQLPIHDTDIFGNGIAQSASKGWIKLESSAAALRGFFLMFDGKLSLMDGANFAHEALTDFVFAEIEAAGATRIEVINKNPYAVDVTFELINSSGYPRVSLPPQTVKGNGAIIADAFSDLFKGITPDPTDYIRAHANGGVHPFELMQKAVGDVSTLPGQNIASGGTTLYAPQYVLGDIYETSLSIINMDSRPGMVQYKFFDEEGNQLGITRRLAISSNGKLHIDNPESFWMIGDPGVMTQGYVEIISENGVRLAGSAVFYDSNQQSFSSALPLIDSLHDSVLFSHVASNEVFFTGIAILNPNAGDATVMLELYAANGTLTDVKSVQIPSGHRISWLLAKYFASLEGKSQISGYVKLISDQPLATFSLFGTTSLSVLSAIPSLTIP